MNDLSSQKPNRNNMQYVNTENLNDFLERLEKADTSRVFMSYSGDIGSSGQMYNVCFSAVNIVTGFECFGRSILDYDEFKKIIVPIDNMIKQKDIYFVDGKIDVDLVSGAIIHKFTPNWCDGSHRLSNNEFQKRVNQSFYDWKKVVRKLYEDGERYKTILNVIDESGLVLVRDNVHWQVVLVGLNRKRRLSEVLSRFKKFKIEYFKSAKDLYV